jgi:hypothetical protein
VRHVQHSHAVLVHFASDETSKASITNAKYGFVAGLAYGMAKPIMMLADLPFECPIDYRILMKTHFSASQAVAAVEPWLDEIVDRKKTREEGDRDKRKSQAEQSFLKQLRLGEPNAENEAETLKEYFVETGPYHEALNTRMCLFIGRKGTGKTANLYQIAETLRRDKRNHVCVIEPVSYDVEAAIQHLKTIKSMAEEGGVYEALWKFVIFSELCRSLSDALNARLWTLSEDEHVFLRYCEEKRLTSETDFALRLRERIQDIETDVKAKWDRKTPVRLAEYLHGGLIAEMRHYLLAHLRDKVKVVVLVDNLDKGWKRDESINELTSFLNGFLSVMGSLVAESGKPEHHQGSIPLRLIAFLRSDIYNHVLAATGEPDKITTARIAWEDSELLLRVISERFMYTNEYLTEKDVWGKVFDPSAGDATIKNFIIDVTYPKPRDVIILIQKALYKAISRGHGHIKMIDLQAARSDYSAYAFNAINAEDANGVGSIETGTYALIGQEPIMTEESLRCALDGVNVDAGAVGNLISAMCKLSVLGLEVEQDDFRYVYDDTQFELISRRAAAYTARIGYKRFKVHPALHPVLGFE